MMGDKSEIEWTDATWNPIRARNLKTGKVGWHCEHATTGCELCYAESMNKRLGTGLPFKPGHRKDIEIFLDEEMLLAPLRWKRPRKIFVCSMTDLFASFVEDSWIDKMFAVMACAGNHTFQILTKRPDRMRQYVVGLTKGRIREAAYAPIHRCVQFEGRWLFDLPLRNIWLGTSAERQEEADERIPRLLQTPTAVRFVSLEPLLGPIDLTELYPDRDSENAMHALAGIRANPDGTATFGPRINWVIVGGESGRKARPMHPDWARSLRDQCQAAGVPFFFKQFGEFAPFDGHPLLQGAALTRRGFETRTFADAVRVGRLGKKHAGRLLDGREWSEMPR